jgi:hypothetical protein
VSEGHGQIRSYQRIFKPQRRIYHVEGRALPVPGGVSLRWLAYAAGALVATLALSSGSAAVMATLTICAALVGLALGGRAEAGVAAITALALAWALGLVLGALDWPLRLVVVPVAVATLATQATPDGRRADRFAASWLALRLAPRRRSLGRATPLPGIRQGAEAELWVAPDQHSPLLRRARIRGAAVVRFAVPIGVSRVGLGRGHLVARPDRGRGRAEPGSARLALGDGELLEVRP